MILCIFSFFFEIRMATFYNGILAFYCADFEGNIFFFLLCIE